MRAPCAHSDLCEPPYERVLLYSRLKARALPLGGALPLNSTLGGSPTTKYECYSWW